jgi:hypothetical protein
LGTYAKLDGTTAKVDDVWFEQDVTDTVEANLIAVSADIASLPDVQVTPDKPSKPQASTKSNPCGFAANDTTWRIAA